MAATDLLALEDAVEIIRLNRSDTYHHARLVGYITAISHRFDDMFGPVVIRTVTGEIHDGGSCSLWLEQRPVVSITSIASWSSGVSTSYTAETVSVAGGYQLDPATGRVTARSGWGDYWWPYGRGNIVVTYQAGRYATTAAVKDTVWYQAAALTLKSLWRGEEDTVAVVNDYEQPQTAIPTFAIPRAAMELLGGQRQMWGIG